MDLVGCAGRGMALVGRWESRESRLLLLLLLLLLSRGRFVEVEVEMVAVVRTSNSARRF